MTGGHRYNSRELSRSSQRLVAALEARESSAETELAILHDKLSCAHSASAAIASEWPSCELRCGNNVPSIPGKRLLGTYFERMLSRLRPRLVPLICRDCCADPEVTCWSLRAGDRAQGDSFGPARGPGVQASRHGRPQMNVQMRNLSCLHLRAPHIGRGPQGGVPTITRSGGASLPTPPILRAHNEKLFASATRLIRGVQLASPRFRRRSSNRGITPGLPLRWLLSPTQYPRAGSWLTGSTISERPERAETHLPMIAVSTVLTWAQSPIRSGPSSINRDALPDSAWFMRTGRKNSVIRNHQPLEGADCRGPGLMLRTNGDRHCLASGPRNQ